jgi:hypothetical protein
VRAFCAPPGSSLTLRPAIGNEGIFGGDSGNTMTYLRLRKKYLRERVWKTSKPKAEIRLTSDCLAMSSEAGGADGADPFDDFRRIGRIHVEEMGHRRLHGRLSRIVERHPDLAVENFE